MDDSAIAVGEITIDVGAGAVTGDLVVPAGARGLVVFAHGSGSSRKSSRNRYVAEKVGNAGYATLLFDLLTPGEDAVDRRTAEYRFDVDMLGERLVTVVDSVGSDPRLESLPVGVFGASTGAAAALIAAAHRPERIAAVVSRGGRPDLAGERLRDVEAPTLLIVGSRDTPVIAMNETAKAAMRCEVVLSIVPGASHLFEEPGTLHRAAQLAMAWFQRTL